MITGQNIRRNGRVGMADMRRVVYIVDWGGDIKSTVQPSPLLGYISSVSSDPVPFKVLL